jgi:glycosyltransferase involved in cell wall biosynthesis
MKVSIAMATFNGSKYIQEQLKSFVEQSRLPDELVVADDGSSDETLEILERFALTSPFSVRVYRNESNLGYAQNFSRALGLCTGDLVFLSDQDDIWFKSKLEAVCSLAEKNPGCQLFMNDAELTGADGNPLGLTKLGQTLSLGLGEKGFTTGCCMAIRRDFLNIALPIPSELFVHDTWLNRLSIILGVKKVVPEVEQYYRRHGENTSDWIASRTVQQNSLDLIQAYRGLNQRVYAQKRLKQLEVIEERLQSKSHLSSAASFSGKMLQEALVNLQAERSAVETRLYFLEAPLWKRWIKATRFFIDGNYRYFSGWKSYAKDMTVK